MSFWTTLLVTPFEVMSAFTPERGSYPTPTIGSFASPLAMLVLVAVLLGSIGLLSLRRWGQILLESAMWVTIAACLYGVYSTLCTANRGGWLAVCPAVLCVFVLGLLRDPRIHQSMAAAEEARRQAEARKAES